ncbi:MAG TPA: DUF1800 domain-containing protein [Actinomycetes bacterium]|nr:DUF1800 domain-containing protein [Actinomycetes bacterium]
MGAGALVTAAGGTSLLAVPAQAATPKPPGSPTSHRYLATDPVLHLIRRATYGYTPTLEKEVRAVGTRTWLEQQLAPSTVSDTTMDAILAKHFPRLNWTIRQVWDTNQFTNYSGDMMTDTLLATVARSLWSKRQLFEVMVEFWSNHLNVTCPSDSVWDNRHLYDRDVIRKHALGNFKDMLLASAKHPAMLNYLNQAESTKDQPNENYGREVLELHTVGVDAGYDENDIYASAKILTGLTLKNLKPPYDDNSGNPKNASWTHLEYYYDTTIHYPSPVQVMGHTFNTHKASGGEADANAYLLWLARHPKTAQRLALKLATHFVSDNPPDSLVTRMANAYTANDTAIVPVLRTLFTSREFATSVEQKVKRPYEDIVGALRTLGVTQSPLPDVPAVSDDPSWRDGLQAIYWQLQDMGHAPMNWPQPDGYPDVAVSWQSSSGLLGRWSTHMSHVAGWWPSASDKTLTWPKSPVDGKKYPNQSSLARYLLPATLPKTWGSYVDGLAVRLLGQTLRPEHKTAVLAFMGKSATGAITQDLTAYNDGWFSWQMPKVVALILDSPYHEMR